MNSQSTILNNYINNESFLPLLQKFYSLEAIAKEKWSNETVLYVGLNKNQLLFENGNGAETLASAIFLKALNLEFEIKFVKNVNEMSPSGKGPLLKCGRYSIGEFEPIVNFCDLKGHHLDAELDLSKKNQTKSYLLLIQSSFSQVLNFFLWKQSTNRKMIQNTFREMYPFPLNFVLYFNEYLFMKNKLETNKVWNISKAKVLEGLNEVLDSMNRKLDGNLYLFENKLSDADIILYSYLKVINTYKEFEQISETLNRFQNLMDFYANLDRKYSNFLKEKLNL